MYNVIYYIKEKLTGSVKKDPDKNFVPQPIKG
jgi:hypothetical protein